MNMTRPSEPTRPFRTVLVLFGMMCATGVGELRVPTDTGATAGVHSAGPVMSAGLAGLSITAIAIDPGEPSLLYAATRTSGVFKSSDSGINSQQFGRIGLQNTNTGAGPRVIQFALKINF